MGRREGGTEGGREGGRKGARKGAMAVGCKGEWMGGTREDWRKMKETEEVREGRREGVIEGGGWERRRRGGRDGGRDGGSDGGRE